MKAIEVRTVQTRREKNIFLTFPWRIYRGDPLWVPPLLPERKKVIDPQKGKFFEDGYAESVHCLERWQTGWHHLMR